MKFNGVSRECLAKVAPRERGAQRLACNERRQAKFSRRADKRSSPRETLGTPCGPRDPLPTTLQHSRTAQTSLLRSLRSNDNRLSGLCQVPGPIMNPSGARDRLKLPADRRFAPPQNRSDRQRTLDQSDPARRGCASQRAAQTNRGASRNAVGQHPA